jgi:antitoxin component YwqK of YwqJK toxin-antitoxin module
MKKIIFILLAFLIQFEICYGCCSGDERTITEKLYNFSIGTVFVGTVIESGQNNENFYAKIKVEEKLFGKIDSSIISMATGSRNSSAGGRILKKGQTYLFYAGGSGVTFGCCSNCDNETKPLKLGEPNFELDLIRKFADIQRKRRNGHYIIKNENGIIIADGWYNQGKPIKEWSHFYDNGIIKNKFEVEINKTTTYFQNGYIQGTNQIKGDTTISELFSKTVEGQLENLIIWFNNYNTEFSREYKNGILKNSHYATAMIGYVNEWIDYYDNGNIYIKGQYSKGKKTGEWITYNEDKTIKKIETFDGIK